MSRFEKGQIGFGKISRFLTITDWLPSYTFRSMRSDLLAGVTVSVILVPQAMAYALLAGMPPVYGLYASLVPLLVYPLMGTSRHVAIGVTAIDALIIGAGVSVLAEPMSSRYIALVLMLTLMTGVIQLALGSFRLGFVVNLLSGPVITGFTAAAAITISISQIRYLSAMPIPRSEYLLQTLQAIAVSITQVHLPTVVLGVSAIILLVLLNRFAPRLPGPLLVVVFSTLAVWLLDLENQGVSIVGTIETTLPGFALVSFSGGAMTALFPTAVTLALVQFMALISLGKLYAAKHRYVVKPNRELFSLGLANAVGSFFRSMPVSASFARSAVNERSGNATPLANAFAAAAVVFVLLVLTDLLFYLPIAALGAIIVVTVLGLVDIPRLKFLYRVKRVDGLIAIITFLVTLFIGITEGVLSGIAASVVAIMYRISRPNVAELGHLPGTRSFRDLLRYPEAEAIEGIAVLRIDASFLFANADFLRDMLLERSALDEDLKYIVIDASSINDLDTSAASALASAARTLRSRDIEIYFGGVKEPVLDTMRLTGLVDLVGASHYFLSPHRAIRYILDHKLRPDEKNVSSPVSDN